MNDFANVVLPYLLLGFLVLIVNLFIARWIFRIDKMIRVQQKQYEVFLQIALKMNVDRNELLKIDDPHEHWKQQQKRKNAQE